MDSKIRVAVLSTSFPRHSKDGAGIFVLRLVRAMEQRGASGVVIAPADPQASGDLGLKGFKIIRAAVPKGVLYGSGALSNLRANPLKILLIPLIFIGFLAATLKASRSADVIHAHWAFSALVACVGSFLTKTPYIIVIRGEDQRLLNSKIAPLFNLAMKRAAKIVVVSEVFLNSLPDTYKRKAVFIPNGAEAEVHPESAESTILRLGLKRGEYLASVGRVYPLKRPEILIEALASIPNLKLVLVGQIQSEDYRKALVNLSERCGVVTRVTFTGALSPQESLEVISGSVVTVSASSHEGRPNSLLEAMALGVPVIASDIPAHLELLGDKKYLFSNAPQCAALVNKMRLEVSFRLQAERDNKLFTSKLTWDEAARGYIAVSYL